MVERVLFRDVRESPGISRPLTPEQCHSDFGAAWFDSCGGRRTGGIWREFEIFRTLGYKGTTHIALNILIHEECIQMAVEFSST
jgi:hypothetical protein